VAGRPCFIRGTETERKKSSNKSGVLWEAMTVVKIGVTYLREGVPKSYGSPR
jgi:hypothetical protein